MYSNEASILPRLFKRFSFSFLCNLFSFCLPRQFAMLSLFLSVCVSRKIFIEFSSFPISHEFPLKPNTCLTCCIFIKNDSRNQKHLMASSLDSSTETFHSRLLTLLGTFQLIDRVEKASISFMISPISIYILLHRNILKEGKDSIASKSARGMSRYFQMIPQPLTR